jgi:two-component system chemotaxis response regulator CheV
MAGVLDGVDRRTQLAGQNRLELLLFRLGDKQRFGINVFKVQEVVPCPPLTQVPHAKPVVRGIANMRGRSITVIDLARAIGRAPITDISNAYVIVTEYNRSVQGFLVSGMDRITNMRWEEILPPPKGTGNHYMTAVTHVDKDLVEIIDVEKVLAEVMRISETVSDQVIKEREATNSADFHVLVADDSSVARKQIQRTLEQLGMSCTVVNDGKQALDFLKKLAAEEQPVTDRIHLVISDVEMPEMDGYTLTTEIRQDPKLRDLYVILHTSLSGIFNNALVEKVGANQFIPKFDPNELARAVMERAKAVAGAG